MKIYIFTPAGNFESTHINPDKIGVFMSYLSEWDGQKLVIPNFLGDGGALFIPEEVAKLSVVRLSET